MCEPQKALRRFAIPTKVCERVRRHIYNLQVPGQPKLSRTQPVFCDLKEVGLSRPHEPQGSRARRRPVPRHFYCSHRVLTTSDLPEATLGPTAREGMAPLVSLSLDDGHHLKEWTLSKRFRAGLWDLWVYPCDTREFYLYMASSSGGPFGCITVVISHSPPFEGPTLKELKALRARKATKPLEEPRKVNLGMSHGLFPG